VLPNALLPNALLPNALLPNACRPGSPTAQDPPALHLSDRTARIIASTSAMSV